MTVERVGFLGGSFNPPHVAHVLAAAYALAVGELDSILVVPVFEHPFSKSLAPFEERVAMCRLAMEGLSRVTVSVVEGELGGASLTLRTLEHLVGLHPDWKMRLVIGSDVLGDVAKWHRFDRVSELAPPLVLPRVGATDARSMLPDVSSSQVRELFAAGDLAALAPLVPRKVLAHAQARGLYGPPG